MRFKSTTTLPEYAGAAPPYVRLRPVEIGYSGSLCSFATLTIDCTCSTEFGATAADVQRSSASPQSGE
jgi:hypothetical protein